MTETVRLGTVTGIEDGLTVRLDGTDSDTPVLRASSYSPTVGDRVKLIRLGGRYVAEYAIRS